MSARGEYGDKMGDCELCGATNVSTREHRVNKAMLAICQKCVGQMNLAPKEEAPGLTQARRQSTAKPKQRSFRKSNIMNKQERELADDFSRRIINGRQSKGWSQAQLGQRMAETVNVIKSAESGKPPTDSVVRKLEMILGIELMIEPTGDHQSMIGQNSNSRGMTIGDYLKDLR
jgi:uncharacterized protein (TIGR00270 family)